MAALLGLQIDRKTLALAVVAFVIIYQFLSWPAPSRRSDISPVRWMFNTSRDERNFGLTDQQCDAAFPGLFDDVALVVDYNHQNGNITEKNIDESVTNPDTVRVMIYDRQIYIVEDHCGVHRNRAASILASIHRAIVAYNGPLPNIEFTLNVNDGPHAQHQWALTRDPEVDKNTWVVNDHVWWAWPVPLIGEYTQVRKEIAVKEPSWENKKAQAVWRGVVNLSKVREDLIKVTEGKDWSDVRGMGWAGKGGSEGASNKDDAIKISDHCNYQYLLYTEGATYSGRFKYLHQCNSVIITHRLKWAEWHGALMKFDGPDQNMVEVRRDWSDLNEKMEWLLANPEKAKRIADNNVKTFRDRYLTPAAQACHVRKMINGWASVQDYQPKLWKLINLERQGIKEPTLRGKPFETWLVEPML